MRAIFFCACYGITISRITSSGIAGMSVTFMRAFAMQGLHDMISLEELV